MVEEYCEPFCICLNPLDPNYNGTTTTTTTTPWPTAETTVEPTEGWNGTTESMYIYIFKVVYLPPLIWLPILYLQICVQSHNGKEMDIVMI